MFFENKSWSDIQCVHCGIKILYIFPCVYLNEVLFLHEVCVGRMYSRLNITLHI